MGRVRKIFANEKFELLTSLNSGISLAVCQNEEMCHHQRTRQLFTDNSSQIAYGINYVNWSSNPSRSGLSLKLALDCCGRGLNKILQPAPFTAFSLFLSCREATAPPATRPTLPLYCRNNSTNDICSNAANTSIFSFVTEKLFTTNEWNNHQPPAWWQIICWR